MRARTSRRRLLRSACAVAAASLAGCVGDDPPELHCEVTIRPSADVEADGDVDPIQYPEPPGEDADIVEWAVDHEHAYVRNRTANRRKPTEFGFDVRETDGESRRHGEIARLAYQFHESYETDGGPVEAHSGIQTAAYYVDDRGALRAHESATGGALDADLDPVADGDTVVCF